MTYKLSDNSKTWTFASRNNLTDDLPRNRLNRITHKTLTESVPEWFEYLPRELLLEESGKDMTCRNFANFLKTDEGVIIWHIFKYTAYHLPIRNDVDAISKRSVCSSVNSTGNRVLTSTDDSIEALVESLLEKTELPYWGKKSKGELITEPLATMLVRLFNYHECKIKGIKQLFNLRPRRVPTADCPACGCRFTHTGKVIEPPYVDVDSTTWSEEEDAIPGGFGWVPGSGWETDTGRDLRRD